MKRVLLIILLHLSLFFIVFAYQAQAEDIEENWIVIAEAIQTILRRERYPNAYDRIKELTRKNKKIRQRAIHDFIENLVGSSDVYKCKSLKDDEMPEVVQKSGKNLNIY